MSGCFRTVPVTRSPSAPFSKVAVMPQVLRFAGPREVTTVDLPTPPLSAGTARVRTIVSGISAGTELTAYRGSNPYLTGTWLPDQHLFASHETETPLSYPLDGWGYSEVGEILEVRPPHGEDTALRPGDVVWGLWGHREEAVVDLERIEGHLLDPEADPVLGTFVRVAGIALNAVLAARLTPGTTVAVVGQGVIGLLATLFAKDSGATVVAVESVPRRAERAARLGADLVFAPSPELPYQVREQVARGGLDAAIEFSGSFDGLQSAFRLVGPDARVVAAGFYQGLGQLRLDQEFHHNRIELIVSQIGAVPPDLRARWDVARLYRVAAALVRKHADEVAALVTHRYPLSDAAEAYRMLDTAGSEALQAVLDMP